MHSACTAEDKSLLQDVPQQAHEAAKFAVNALTKTIRKEEHQDPASVASNSSTGGEVLGISGGEFVAELVDVELVVWLDVDSEEVVVVLGVGFTSGVASVISPMVSFQPTTASFE